MMGGRRELLDSPAVEVLKFMDMALEEEEAKAKKEKSDLYMQYLITHFAQIVQGEESAERRMERDKLLHSLRPEQEKKVYSWGNPELDAMALELETQTTSKGR